MADERAKGKDETLTGIDQRMINQRGLSQMKIEVMLPEMIEKNKGASGVAKRGTLKETAWQRTFTYTIRRRTTKMLI